MAWVTLTILINDYPVTVPVVSSVGARLLRLMAWVQAGLHTQ